MRATETVPTTKYGQTGDAANELKEKFKNSCPYQIIEALGINLKLEAGQVN